MILRMKVYMGNIQALDKIGGIGSFRCFASLKDMHASGTNCRRQTWSFTNLKVQTDEHSH